MNIQDYLLKHYPEFETDSFEYFRDMLKDVLKTRTVISFSNAYINVGKNINPDNAHDNIMVATFQLCDKDDYVLDHNDLCKSLSHWFGDGIDNFSYMLSYGQQLIITFDLAF